MKNDFDKYHRYRGTFVGFRVTKEENEMINRMATLTGMTKQDYIVKRLSCENITVVPSTRVYKALRDRMNLVYQELTRIADGGCPDERVLALTELLAKEFVGFRTNDARPANAAQDMLLGMSRT